MKINDNPKRSNKAIHYFIRIPKFLPSLNFLPSSDFESRIILKLVLNTKSVTSSLRNIFQFFVDVLQHHKTKQEFIFCIDSAKVHLKAVV